MYQSQLFSKTNKTPPKEAESISHQLLVRGGFIDQLAAGIYTFLPLGWRVYKKIEQIIRQEMDAVGGQELLMPALTPKEIWQTTNRWDNFDALYKLKISEDKEFALAATHEEVITPLAKKFIRSYKDLPLYVYQIQNKFRNEKRAKSGLLRVREFIMKDLYSFHLTEKDLDAYYEKVKKSYQKIFSRCGLGPQTYLTLASGGSFSPYSHEFQTVTPAGEDTVHICQNCHLAINQEIKKEHPACPDCRGQKFKEAKAIEVGNIFKLMTRFSEPNDLKVLDKDGKNKLVLMCSYGIGLGRLLATVVEVNHDQQGITWPTSVAPFAIHLLALGGEANTLKTANSLYQTLTKHGWEVLYDDRTETAGVKFADADLLGLPLRLVVSNKTSQARSVEVKLRAQDKSQLIKISNLIKQLPKLLA